MSGLVYHAKEPDTLDSSEPLYPPGWPSGWTRPNPPWPPGFPIDLPSGTWLCSVTCTDPIDELAECNTVARFTLDGVDDSSLEGYVVRVTASNDDGAVELKDETCDFATTLYFYIENYTGSRYGIDVDLVFDADSEGGTVTVLVELLDFDEELEGSDTVTINSGVDYARLATIQNHGLSGLTAFDGVTPVAGDRVLVWKQTTASENGIYTAASGSWSLVKALTSAATMIDKPIFVSSGNIFGQTSFYVTAANTATWQRTGWRAKCATTSNHGLTGTSSVDGISISEGDLVLVWAQSTASQNGLYIVLSSGTWTKVASFALVDIGTTIAVGSGTTTPYGKLTFTVTAANTVAAMGAVFI